MSTYADKIRDPRWQKKRLEIMQRDGFVCTCCGDTGSTLNVNHLRYGPEPWEIEDKYLETLCEQCHSWRTAFDKNVKTRCTKDIQRLINGVWDGRRTPPWIGDSQ